MAFTNTTGRFASFGTVSHIPGEVIDAFWYIIDNNLKGVFTLDPVISFDLLNSNGKLSIKFYQDTNPTTITVDFEYPYSSNFPRTFHATDNMGRETIMLPQEL